MIEKIKRYLGISNAALAYYLDTSLDYIKSVISGRRLLSLPALQKLLIVHKALQLNKKVHELPWVAGFLQQQETYITNNNLATLTKINRIIISKEAEVTKETAKVKELLRGGNTFDSLLKNTLLTPEKQNWAQRQQRIVTGRISERFENIVRIHTELEALKAKRNYLSNVKITSIIT